jgi:hypothetical protein
MFVIGSLMTVILLALVFMRISSSYRGKRRVRVLSRRLGGQVQEIATPYRRTRGEKGRLLYRTQLVDVQYLLPVAVLVTMTSFFMLLLYPSEVFAWIFLLGAFGCPMWYIVRSRGQIKIHENGIADNGVRFTFFDQILAIYPFDFVPFGSGLKIEQSHLQNVPYLGFHIFFSKDPENMVVRVLRKALGDRWNEVFRPNDPIVSKEDLFNPFLYLDRELAGIRETVVPDSREERLLVPSGKESTQPLIGTSERAISRWRGSQERNEALLAFLMIPFLILTVFYVVPTLFPRYAFQLPEIPGLRAIPYGIVLPLVYGLSVLGLVLVTVSRLKGITHFTRWFTARTSQGADKAVRSIIETLRGRDFTFDVLEGMGLDANKRRIRLEKGLEIVIGRILPKKDFFLVAIGLGPVMGRFRRVSSSCPPVVKELMDAVDSAIEMSEEDMSDSLIPYPWFGVLHLRLRKSPDAAY